MIKNNKKNIYMSSPSDIVSNQLKKIEETIFYPQTKLFKSCKDLSQLITNYFFNKAQSSVSSVSSVNNVYHHNHHNNKEKYDKKNHNNNHNCNCINNNKLYDELLNDKIFFNHLKQLFCCLNSVINHLKSYIKKIIDEEKMKILFDLKIQLNEYLNNIPKEQNKKVNYFISSKAELNDTHIINQINKFIFLTEKKEQETKDVISTATKEKENNFDNLSEIGEKESAGESIFEEKRLVEHLKVKEEDNEKIRNGDDIQMNDLSFLNRKAKRKDNNNNNMEFNET
jgi:hypothetical protein